MQPLKVNVKICAVTGAVFNSVSVLNVSKLTQSSKACLRLNHSLSPQSVTFVTIALPWLVAKTEKLLTGVTVPDLFIFITYVPVLA